MNVEPGDLHQRLWWSLWEYDSSDRCAHVMVYFGMPFGDRNSSIGPMQQELLSVLDIFEQGLRVFNECKAHGNAECRHEQKTATFYMKVQRRAWEQRGFTGAPGQGSRTFTVLW